MDIFEIYKAAADEEKAKPMSAYMRGQFPFLGIAKPERKELNREFFRTMDKNSVDWGFVFKCWDEPAREFQYLACEYLARLKALLSPVDLPNLRKIAVEKSWWDTIDSLDRIVGDLALRYPEVNETLLAWSLDENIWLRRIAIDHQMLRKNKTDTVLLEQILVNNFGQSEFFVNKAIGWILREYSKTNPSWVRGFIERHAGEMARLSVREASKYI